MNIRWTALIVSWVVDIGGTNVFGFILFTILFATGALPIALASDQQALTAWLVARPDVYAISVAGGTFFSALAGYVAARMAGRAMLLHGVLSSAACLAFDVLSRDQLMLMPAWIAIFGVALAPAAGLAGAYVRQFEVRRARPVTA